MSFSVKGYSGSDSDRPPNYWVVDESEVVVKDREIRSQRPDVHYLSSRKAGVDMGVNSHLDPCSPSGRIVAL